MTHIKTIIIVPAYNESNLLLQVLQALLQQPYATVVLVDDGSATPLKGMVRHLPVTVLRHRVNLGQGAALQTGFAYARQQQADLVITFDADGQHSVHDLPALLTPLITQEADITLGSRFLQSQEVMPRGRKQLLQLARYINYFFCGLLLSDAHNGLRAMNKKALQALQLRENRMAHASEILFQVKQQGLRYKEVPVQITYTAYSRQKGQSGWDSIKVLFDLVLHKLFS